MKSLLGAFPKGHEFEPRECTYPDAICYDIDEAYIGMDDGKGNFYYPPIEYDIDDFGCHESVSKQEQRTYEEGYKQAIKDREFNDEMRRFNGSDMPEGGVM